MISFNPEPLTGFSRRGFLGAMMAAAAAPAIVRSQSLMRVKAPAGWSETGSILLLPAGVQQLYAVFPDEDCLEFASKEWVMMPRLFNGMSIGYHPFRA